MHSRLAITTAPSSAFESSSSHDAVRRQRDRAAAETLATIRAIADDAARPESVRSMANYIGEYLFDAELDLGGIIASARHDETEPGELALLFSEHTDLAPMAFVDHHRLQVALGLMTRENLTVAAASELAGFPTLARFERASSSFDSMSPEIRELAERYRGAARSVRTDDVEPTLRWLVETHTRPQIHALVAYLLDMLPAAPLTTEGGVEPGSAPES